MKDKGKYFEAVGRRKTAVARVRLYADGKGHFTVNDLPLEKYFTIPAHQAAAKLALATPLAEGVTPLAPDQFSVTVKTMGGGIHGQAEAIRHGLGRALILWQAELRPAVRAAGHLTRDGRMKERRKFGLKKARKSPQWSKR
jgi:small subunit ribosomal protein S9